MCRTEFKNKKQFKNMNIPLAKLKALLRYFCAYTNPELLGKTKLMKLFYFVDFEHIKRHGVPITYDTYIHLERGPIPSKILNLVNSVKDEGEEAILSDTITVKEENLSSSSSIQKIGCISEFTEEDKKYFSDNELKVMDQVVKLYKDKNAKELVDASHSQAPWSETRELDEIPYTLAAHDDDCLVEEEDIKLLAQI